MLARAVATECDVNFISIKVFEFAFFGSKSHHCFFRYRDLNSYLNILVRVKNQYVKLFVGMSSIFVAFRNNVRIKFLFEILEPEARNLAYSSLTSSKVSPLGKLIISNLVEFEVVLLVASHKNAILIEPAIRNDFVQRYGSDMR